MAQLTLKAGFGSFVIIQGSGPMLLLNPIFLWFFRRSRPPVPPLDPPMITETGSEHKKYVSTKPKLNIWFSTWDLLHLQALKAQKTLHIRAVSTEPLLLPHIKWGHRKLRPTPQKGALGLILQYFWTAVSDEWYWKPIFMLFLSGHLRQVLLNSGLS